MFSKRIAYSEKLFQNVNKLFVNKIQIFSYNLNSKFNIQNTSKLKFNINKQTKKLLSTEATNQSSNTNSSIDPEEIKKFQSLADSWWVENGEFEALHKLNLLRVPLIRDTLVNYRNSLSEDEKDNILRKTGENQSYYSIEELIREPLLGLNILDVGCGGGILAENLARLGASVTAIDACKENIYCAKIRVESELKKSNNSLKFYNRLNYLNCSLEELAAIEDNSCFFDSIVMSEVVEHVANLKDFINNSTKLLKQNGFTFVTTINRTPQSYLLAILAAEYLFKLVPQGTHNWEKFVKPDELKEILEKNEVFVKFEMGMSYNPLTKTWCWSKEKSVNYALYAQKLHLNQKAN